MSLDAASYPVLWQISDEAGVRPEYLLLSLWVESGLNPAIQNLQGADYWGINQASGTWIQQNLGITPQEYIKLPASQQLLKTVLPMAKGWPKPLLSGTRVEQANYLPATVNGTAGWKAARYPADVVVSSTAHGGINASGNYNAGLDVGKKGYITVADLETFVRKAVPNVQSTLAAVYALRPSETMQDPVLGTDPYLTNKPVASTNVTGTDVALAVGGSAVILTSASLLAWYLTKRRAA